MAKELLSNDRHRNIAMLSAQGMTSFEISEKIGMTPNAVRNVLGKNNVKEFKAKFNNRVVDKIITKNAKLMSDALAYAQNNVLKHLKNIDKIGMESENDATKLRASESFCKIAGMSFKEKEEKNPSLPDLNVNIPKQEKTA